MHKDVKRNFGVFQSRFVIIQNLCKWWDHNVVYNIMYPCVIMHYMIIEDEENVRLEICFDTITIPIKCDLTIDEYTHGNRKIENPNVHYKLHNDFTKYLWVLKRNNEVQ